MNVYFKEEPNIENLKEQIQKKFPLEFKIENKENIKISSGGKGNSTLWSINDRDVQKAAIKVATM